jgi:hypothetical protein
MAEVDLDVRRRAAERAREVLDGRLSAEAFREEFADAEDRAVAELIDLMEHEPVRGGLLGGGEAAWRNYQQSILDLIAGLSA